MRSPGSCGRANGVGGSRRCKRPQVRPAAATALGSGWAEAPTGPGPAALPTAVPTELSFPERARRDLEALASASKSQGKVMTALDAGREEVYAGQYEVTQRARLISERLLTIEEFLREAAGHAVITSDSAIAGTARAAGLGVEQVDSPRSDAIARLGWQKILAGETVSPQHLEANYLRRSDAEIFSKSH